MADPASIIEALYAGTADNADVFRALGWRIVPHGSWSGRIAKVGNGRCEGVGRVTSRIGDAMHLIHWDKREESMRAAMALNRPLEPAMDCPIARRICIIALTRPDLRSEHATPEGA